MTDFDAPFVELVMTYFNGANIDSETMRKMYTAYKKGVQVGMLRMIQKSKKEKEKE